MSLFGLQRHKRLQTTAATIALIGTIASAQFSQAPAATQSHLKYASHTYAMGTSKSAMPNKAVTSRHTLSAKK